MDNNHVSVCQKPFSILSLGTCLYSVDTHNRNRLKSLVTMSRVTYFILWAHTGKCISHNTVEKREEGLEKINEGEWTRQAEIRTRKNFLAVGKACIAVFDLLLVLKGENISASVLNSRKLNFCTNPCLTVGQTQCCTAHK